MQAHINRSRYLTSLVTIVLIALVISCAAAVNIIAPSVWIGALDVVAAVAISVFILTGSNK